jgi:hypothetical protein
VFKQIQDREPWCVGATPVVEAAIITTEKRYFVSWETLLPEEILGATQMLQDAQVQFDIIDEQSDFEKYRVLILPDEVQLSLPAAARLARYVEQGGSVIASHNSLSQTPEWRSQLFGVASLADSPFEADFISSQAAIYGALAGVEHVMYRPGKVLGIEADVEMLAQITKPYFARTWKHFCSHKHTPSSGQIQSPAIIRRGRCWFFAHPIFTIYRDFAPRWCRTLVSQSLHSLQSLLIQHDGPNSLVVSLTQQPGRHVVHLLHYIPQRKSRHLDIIEDPLTLHNLKLSLLSAGYSKARLVPQDVPLALNISANRTEITVPDMAGHQMIELNLEEKSAGGDLNRPNSSASENA